MIKTQVQLPDDLYYKAKAIAGQREWSPPVLEKGDFRTDFDQLDLKTLAESDELWGDGAFPAKKTGAQASRL